MPGLPEKSRIPLASITFTDLQWRMKLTHEAVTGTRTITYTVQFSESVTGFSDGIGVTRVIVRDYQRGI